MYTLARIKVKRNRVAVGRGRETELKPGRGRRVEMDAAHGLAAGLRLLDVAHEHPRVVDTLRIHAGGEGRSSGLWYELDGQVMARLLAAHAPGTFHRRSISLNSAPGSPANGPSGLDAECLCLAKRLDALNDHTFTMRHPPVALSKVELDTVESRWLEDAVVERDSLKRLEQYRRSMGQRREHG